MCLICHSSSSLRTFLFIQKKVFNSNVIIGRCFVQYWQLLSSFLIFCFYLTRIKACETSCKIWKTRKIFPILHLALCNNNYITYDDFVSFYRGCRNECFSFLVNDTTLIKSLITFQKVSDWWNPLNEIILMVSLRKKLFYDKRKP